jgi:hypothetical protein
MVMRMLPPATGNATVKVNGGRTYVGVPGTFQDIPDFDAGELSANGWLSLGSVGATAARPAVPFVGQVFNDTTVGGNVVWDGKNWRHHQTLSIS